MTANVEEVKRRWTEMSFEEFSRIKKEDLRPELRDIFEAERERRAQEARLKASMEDAARLEEDKGEKPTATIRLQHQPRRGRSAVWWLFVYREEFILQDNKGETRLSSESTAATSHIVKIGSWPDQNNAVKLLLRIDNSRIDNSDEETFTVSTSDAERLRLWLKQFGDLTPQNLYEEFSWIVAIGMMVVLLSIQFVLLLLSPFVTLRLLLLFSMPTTVIAVIIWKRREDKKRRVRDALSQVSFDEILKRKPTINLYSRELGSSVFGMSGEAWFEALLASAFSRQQAAGEHHEALLTEYCALLEQFKEYIQRILPDARLFKGETQDLVDDINLQPFHFTLRWLFDAASAYNRFLGETRQSFTAWDASIFQFRTIRGTSPGATTYLRTTCSPERLENEICRLRAELQAGYGSAAKTQGSSA